MMQPVHRIRASEDQALTGVVKYDLKKSFWNLGLLSCAVIFAPIYFSWSALLLFLISTYFSLLIGHSAGMHRMMIHRAYKCPKWLERILIYIGVLVGMSGPFGIIKIHDIRDWAQRQSRCHDFFSHKRGYFLDLWWQLTCRFEFASPPNVIIEPHFYDDKFYRFLEHSWRYHQLLIAVLLYLLGGFEFVVWGVFVRVSVSIVGHWSITYFCHNPGPGRWLVKGASVQASNIKGLGLVTYGECWHNNHHAFPESAKIGLESHQSDPTWRFIQLLQWLNLAHQVGLPRKHSDREDLLEK